MAPNDASREATEQVEVAIIGCGPVGAMLANLLGLQGVSCVVLEREAEIYALPRAVHFDDEVMRLFQTVGLADAMQSLVHVSPGMKFIDDAGRLLLDWSRPQGIGPQAWHFSYRFHQPDLERVLRSGLARWPTVTVRLRTEVFAVEEASAGIEVAYEDLATARLGRLRANYVVGCDGARSLIRRLIGRPMEDLGFHERWLVIDAILKRPRPDLGDYSIQHCSTRRPATYVRGTGDRRRWEIAVLPHEDGPTLTQPAAVYALLQPWVTSEDVELERAALYTFHSALAPVWRAGRLLIAGDSAHLTPPFLGQGMCAGMRDAGNLAWKLARVLRGQADDGLLDTYQEERCPHVREYIELAVRLGGLINTKAMAAALPESALPGGEAARMSSLKPTLKRVLTGGWDEPAGQIAPQPLLADGSRLDDRVGYRFAALVEPELAETMPPRIRELLAARDVVIVADEAPEQRAWLRQTGAAAVLVRPDRYVLGAARSIQELDALAQAI
ncbi:bifunctional 3-(3-hydroxy-phenyl)propionate/3-hydroxycinnamic acid hydroxylase [Methylobacterium aquaticum]|uniref:3-(3-hydroxyphenyl)propionate hydroxylase n=1 Tax=Methylobacterium aquaticum TaxID=270351 RepID=A0A0J6SEY9_9HYPH|nr:bifunctional 3-(3-hydroxy-phenyl)propionate/3-hydroxycinnamic acid hydroxylase [Methylobacterium aquaticum]KMO32224.1 3-(3-hydroxyphenyl)propionate hydroxylase [Methylobacterium aquaticum]